MSHRSTVDLSGIAEASQIDRNDSPSASFAQIAKPISGV
jgi:hypothetical protein